MLDDAARFDLVVTIEDGYADGGIGAQIASFLSERGVGNDRRPLVRVLGIPVRYIHHDKPDAILADLGLDADGIVAEVHRCRPR